MSDPSVEKGEVCYDCLKGLFPPKGKKSLCWECEEMKSSEDEVDHSSYIRCPKCKGTRNVTEPDFIDGIFEEGQHIVFCDNCSHCYTVSTQISHTFVSPPIIIDDPSTDTD